MGEVVQSVAEEGAAEDAIAAGNVETVVDTGAADEAAEGTAAEETIETIAERTMEANTEG